MAPPNPRRAGAPRCLSSLRSAACALAVLPLAALQLACSAEPEPAAAPTGVPAFRHQALYDQVQEDADGFTQREGDWLEDQGDAAFYGLAFGAHRAAETGSAVWAARADAARARSLTLIATPDLLAGDVNEMAMSALGLIERVEATGDRADVEALEAFIGRVERLVTLVGWYLDIDAIGSWALDTYGPTSISALVGLVSLQQAYDVGGDTATAHTAWAAELATHIDERAWNGAHYEFGAGRTGLFLYPNVAMLLLHGRLFQLTGDEQHRARALALYDAIQPLRLSTAPTRYYTPYSAEYMGATTRDYSTLSAHNYLMFALTVLHQITGERRFIVELDQVLDSIGGELHGEWCLSHVHRAPCAPACAAEQACVVDACVADTCGGGVLHHWIDGRISLPTDREHFCSGCNLQLLFVTWYRQHRLDAAPAP